MPELPEVETTRAGIEPWLVNQRIVTWTVRDQRLRWPVELPELLRNQTVAAVNRRGKYLLLDVGVGQIIIHLGMSGSLRIVAHDTAVKTHDHVDWQLSNGRVLRLNDPRRFGCVLFHPAASQEAHWLLAHLGPEPLGNAFSGAYLFSHSRNKKVAIKNFIMDSKVVVGVGNIYAAEALFMSGIRPATAARRVTRKGYDNLAMAIREVLARSVREGGTTLRDFVGSDGNPGYFKQRLNVYGRQGQPCRVCGATLVGRVIGQRASVYCPKCQSSQSFEPPQIA